MLNGKVSESQRASERPAEVVIAQCAECCNVLPAAAVLGSYLAGVAGVQFFAYVGPGADGDLLASSSSTQGQAAASACLLRRPLPSAAALARSSTPRAHAAKTRVRLENISNIFTAF